MTRILVVEDEIDLLDEVASFLRRRGLDVLTANCHAEGLRVLRDSTQVIDIMLTDVRLPDGNGIDLIPVYFERGGNRRTCFVMTGHYAQAQASGDLQGVRIFAKPFSLSQLYREIKAVIDVPQAA
ncbi:MAG: response regulator [Alphaproteobacteria bacterium]|nr:response regulator [Alphaproteobacteria bacterium]